AETDSHYIVNFTGTDDILLFGKDSFGTHEWLTVERNWSDLFFGDAITVENQLIRTYDSHKRCIEPDDDDIDRAIVILNEDFSVKNRLIVGNSCLSDDWGKMHYLNPDSIYYAYETNYEIERKYGNTLSIANFSLSGELNFDYLFDLPRPADLLYYRTILRCQAVSNGGVLVSGYISDYSSFDDSTGEGEKVNGFLLYYHPTIENLDISEIEKNVSVVSVFPNPAQSQFTVTNTENTEIQLFNTLGQEVFRTHSTEENTVVEVGSFPQGVYMLKVLQQDGSFSVHKVVKQ
ncbi:MAG: T9SS type A sorting domain-containing protein, partial [Lentimicrobiaceae bacterium]|nr:T9SS type A sorting domain-containing protein [Lentimicrobiaceae bacterium]